VEKSEKGERQVKKALLAVACLAILAGGISAAGAAPRASLKSKGNPWGVTMVRFTKGTTLAQMKAAVAAAGGGGVITDLGKVNRLTVAPGSAGAAAFMAKIKTNKAVLGVSVERVVADVLPDASGGGVSGSNQPALGNPGATTPPDPFHEAPTIFGLDTQPEGQQWDDKRMNVNAAWSTTLGNRSVRVAVIDTGVQGSHKELLPNYDNQDSTNTIPCDTMTREFGPGVHKLIGDCSSEDKDGHGTWVAGRIAGAANGFGSNGIAPKVQVMGIKVLAVGFGGFTSWIVDGMIHACDAGADIINMSIGGYDDPTRAADQEDYLEWVDAVNYCRAKGTAIFASAGNEHVRINRVNMTVGGRALTGVGQVDAGDEGIASITPGGKKSDFDLRGLLELPAGVPGVIMVSATNNKVMPAPTAFSWGGAALGSTDQLTYYSNYGSRIDIAAPGGARKFNIPRVDGGVDDVLRDGWGILGPVDPSGELCALTGGIGTFACFKVNGAGFGFLQGTSMSSPNAAGVGALTLAAHPALQGNPAGLLARLIATARTNMTNHMGPNDPANSADSVLGGPCPTGWCHVDQSHPIPFADAYGAGIVNAAAAVGP
jgi:lantibiotic leader peptide-processing serine protease